MGYRGTIGKTNWTLGEVSPRVFGRFDQDKPIYKNGAAILENMLIFQSGAVMFRPGTQFIAFVKNSSNKVRLERFTYSISEEYVMEIGNEYIRFYSNANGSPGEVIVPSAPSWITSKDYVIGNYVTESGTIYYCLVNHTSGVFSTDLSAGDWIAQIVLEIPTIFQQEEIFNLQTANKADVMYIVDESYPPQKLIRTSATSFTISNVNFIRGPFLDSNITSTTITPSSATGATTLTASAPLFEPGHVGSLWCINVGAVLSGSTVTYNGGVVLITSYTDSTHVSGVVQDESLGSAGNLQTTSATTSWAEGAFSDVRGYPSSVTFHEGRLVYAGVPNSPQTIYGSVVGEYDNFDDSVDLDAYGWVYEIASNVVNGIRWLNSDTALKIGTSGGTITANDGGGGAGITPTNPPSISFDTDYGVMATSSQKVGGYLFYLRSNQFNLCQLTYDLIISRDKSNDMNLLADHILRDGGGAVQMAVQQSPSDRIWVIRADGQIAILTRNPDQQVTGWCRIIGGESDYTNTCNGLGGGFESIAILPIDGNDDQVWVICERLIGGTFYRFIEVFTNELFDNYWEPVRMDCSLSYNNPISITGISNTNPVVVTAPAHGFSNGDLVKIDNVIGLGGALNEQIFKAKNVTTDTFELWSVDS